MQEKYIGKSTGITGRGTSTPLPTEKKVIDINTPVVQTAEEHNASLGNISEEIKKQKVLGSNVIVRFFLFTDPMVDALYAKIPTESGTKMDAVRQRPYQDYGILVAKGEGCSLLKGVKIGSKVRVMPSISGEKKVQYAIHTNGSDFDNYFLLNENLIMSYE